VQFAAGRQLPGRARIVIHIPFIGRKRQKRAHALNGLGPVPVLLIVGFGCNDSGARASIMAGVGSEFVGEFVAWGKIIGGGGGVFVGRVYDMP